MTDISTDFSYVPLVGENNIALFLDPQLPPPHNTVFYPTVQVTTGGPGDSILKSSTGDGKDPSLISKDPVGRPGSLRTTLLFQVLRGVDVSDGADRLVFNVGINIPPGMQGLVPDGLSEAQINDPNNFPIIDPSQFMPRIQGYGTCGPWSPEPNVGGPDQQFPYEIGGEGEPIPVGISFTGCSQLYVPPQSYGTLEATAGAGVEIQGGPYGILVVALSVSGSDGDGGSVPLAAGTNLVLDVDFSHSISN